jgi:hypothetical protein
MQGQFLPVWRDTWRYLWLPLARRSIRLGHPDLFGELFPDLNLALVTPRSVEQLAQIAADVTQARNEFRSVKAEDLRGELDLLGFLEGCYETLGDLGGDVLANGYFVLLDRFLKRFGLRYDLRRPCRLCPTLEGVFSGLVTELHALTAQDEHLDRLMKDFEAAVRDLRDDCSDGRIRTCIQKQMNLLEALGRQSPGVTADTLGAMCGQLRTWPHDKVRESMRALYGFASDYPGIRHAGTPGNALRTIEMRDMVAMSILLAGFTPYLGDQLNADSAYRGR